MTTPPRTKRATDFEDEGAESAFDKSVMSFFTTVQKGNFVKHLSPENTHRLRHGDQWSHPGLPHAVNGGLEQHFFIVEISFEDIVKLDLGIVSRFTQKLVVFSGDIATWVKVPTIFQL